VLGTDIPHVVVNPTTIRSRLPL